ncbi:DUF2332 domain-containing protein [uncultured Erythrobacter sp.]|uniref:DUF2332 domain-containing protein n=1 Tax=uncultured Erythrobacter sp. TaxID=263913 RepID=UPI00262F9A58|nr:DUF2332 domain-containing protein [uncultured Erythrobacter sp.]
MSETGSGSGNEAVMEIDDFAVAVEWQAEHAEAAHAPCTARIIRALTHVIESDTACARRMASWQGLTLKDAMPLRIAGGLHHLLLSGADDRLARVYSGQITDQGQINRLVCKVVETHDHSLLPWFDGPPQTNEAGRSASIMAGLLWLAKRVSPCFELFELGASAGVNTMLDRYHFRLGETKVGFSSSPLQIEPEWRGSKGSPPAPSGDFLIQSVHACDVQPIDLSDPQAALKLKSYVWPDAPGRLARIDAAVQLANEDPPLLVQMDALEFVEQRLAVEQEPGITKAMFHSIMWQYMPVSTQDAITERFETAGAQATPETPLGWVALETDPKTFRHELKVRFWNGGASDGESHTLAFAHPHGAWVEWLGL